MTHESDLLLGQMRGELAGLAREVCLLRKDVGAITDELVNLRLAMAEQRGSWKTLMVVGSMSAAIGAAGAFLAGWVGVSRGGGG